MNKFLLSAILLFVLSACQKDPSVPDTYRPPVMRYTELHDAVVNSTQIRNVDLDGDGQPDLLFHTLLLGDPILQRDRLQFYAGSRIGIHLLNDEQDQSPVLNRGDWVRSHNPGYEWYELSAIVLAEKIIPLNGSVSWEGRWKAARHQYLPVQVNRNGVLYQGWVELSFDTASEQLILHRAALSTEAGREVRAGE